MAKEIKFNIKLNIDGKNVVVQASQSVKELQRNLMAAKTGSQRLGEAMLRINQITQAYQNISSSVGALAGVMNTYIDKANASTMAQTKLTTIMRQRMGATEADTAAVNDAVAAQTKLGIIGGTVQRSGLQQLATFASHRQTLQTLLPAMNNLLAQQKGLNATNEDAVGVANLMGKALMGNVGALTRVGITLTDHQKELIRTGDEYTRASTLAQAITDNVGNMNAELAKTDAGQVKKAQMAFAGIEVAIGKAIAPLQGLMNQFAQIGLAIGGVGQLCMAVTGLSRAIGITTLATSIWGARSIMTTAVTNVLAAAFNGAAVGATTLKWAIRGLLSATLVGAALTALGMALGWLIEKLSGSSEASDKLGQKLKETGNAFEEQRKQALAPTLTKYQELQTKWKSLKSAHEKNQFIKTNKDAFQQLGVSIDSVGQAESFFVSNTKSVQDAMYARAEAAAAAALAEQEMQKALELESKVQRDRDRDKRNYKNTHHTGDTGRDLALDLLVDNGGIKVTSRATQADERALRQAQQNVRSWNRRSITASARANKGLRPYKSRGSGGGASSSSGGGVSSGRGGSVDTGTKEKALRGSLDWYDQQMSTLRKKMYATNDESVAEGLQKQYKELEQKSKDLKVKIGIEKPDMKEAKSYVEQLQDKLKEAQKQMDNATTVEARVEASAKVDDLQHQIDVATRGEVTISAKVEPSYIVKGSEADKLQSYHNAQSNGQNVQSLLDAGIIDEAEAKRRIENINKQLKKLGVKPITIEIKKTAIDQAKESIKELTQSFGGNQFGSNILQVVKAFKDVGKAAKEAKTGTTGAGKDFNATGAYAAAAGAGLATMGQGLEQLGGQGAAAKAGAVMAAIGQIVLGFATYTAKSADLGPWGWVAAVASGLGILASTVATLKGYATGGVLTGPTSSGDKLLFRGNAGEMIFNTAQQRRLYAIANGNYLPRLPQMQTVRPQVGAIGDASQVMTINVRGKLKGNDMELMGSNTRALGAKIGKRY